MSNSSRWLTAILVSIIFHVAAIVGFVYVLPHFTPAQKVADVAEIEWVDVELADDVVVAEAIPSDAVQETLPTFDAQDLVVPEIKTPEPVELKPPEVKPVEVPKPKPKPQPAPQPSTTQPESKPPIENNSPATKTEPANDSRVMGKPPVIVKEIYPERGSELGFKGYISFAARIGKDGKVKSTEIIQSSGRMFVDEIARKAAEQWTYRPALDQSGRPMECDTIITFNFKKLNS